MSYEPSDYLVTPETRQRYHRWLTSQIRHEPSRRLAAYRALPWWRRIFRRRPKASANGGYTASMDGFRPPDR